MNEAIEHVIRGFLDELRDHGLKEGEKHKRGASYRKAYAVAQTHYDVTAEYSESGSLVFTWKEAEFPF